MRGTVLEEGRSCWRRCHAERVSFVIDGAAYFAALVDAFAAAERSIYVVGWDVNSQVELVRDGDGDLPTTFRDLLPELAARRPELEVRVLVWDFAAIYALEREFVPLFKYAWRRHERVHVAFDGNHPAAASHHQKLVVVDDSLAFAGGIDITANRWDTSEHLAEDSRRRAPRGGTYGPFHDAQAAVAGEVAEALGQLARERWRRGTGEAPDTPGPRRSLWLPCLEVHMRDVRVGIARTDPGAEGGGVREAERLWLDAIAAADRAIYVENQYLSCDTVARAMCERLRQSDGPDVVLILPREASGWLERTVVDVRRAELLGELREADRHGRLRVLVPVAEDGRTDIYVHAKVLIVDNDLVRIGSSNLSNRSMGLDTELDLVIEAAGDDTVRDACAALRRRLMAEHLAVAAEDVARVEEQGGGLCAVVDTLTHPGRALERLSGDVPDWLESITPAHELMDPNEPISEEDLMKVVAPEELEPMTLRTLAPRILRRAAAVLALAWLAWAAFHSGPFGPVPDLFDAVLAARSTRVLPETAGLVLLAYVLSTSLLVPVSLLTVVTALLLGPATGLPLAAGAVAASAALGYVGGRLAGRERVRHAVQGQVNRLSRRLVRPGIRALAAVRLSLIVPFAVTNLVAGASRVPPGRFMAGTMLGLAPSLLGMTFLGWLLGRALVRPSVGPVTVLVCAAVLIVTATVVIRRRLLQDSPPTSRTSPGRGVETR